MDNPVNITTQRCAEGQKVKVQALFFKKEDKDIGGDKVVPSHLLVDK